MLSFLNENQLLFVKQALKYGVVGLFNTAITYILFIVFTEFEILSDNVANFVVYFIGFLMSLYFNAKWTFKSKVNDLRNISLFTIVFWGSYGVQYVVFRLLTEFANIDPKISQLGALVVFTGLNFILNKYITFQGAQETKLSDD